MRRFLADSSIVWPLRYAGALTALFPLMYLAGSAVADVAAALISLLFLYDSARRKDWSWLRQRWVQLALLLGGYFFLRGIGTEESGAAMIRAATWLRYPLFAAALGFWALRPEAVRRTLLYSLTAALCLLMGDSLIQYWRGEDLLGHPPMTSLEGSLRLTGPFADPKVGIILAWLGIPALAGLLTPRAEGSSFRFLPLLAGGGFALMFLLIVFLSGERMALLLSLFGLALLGLLHAPLRRGTCALLLVGMLGLGMLAERNPVLMKRQYESTLHTIQHYQDSPYGLIWQSSLAMLRDHPLFGVGPRHFRVVCPRPDYNAIGTVKQRCNLHPHQLYLEWAVEGGVVALLLFVGLLGALAAPVLRNLRTLLHNPLTTGLTVALILRIWPLSTSTSFFAGWSALPFWLIAGWLLAEAYRQQRILSPKC